VAKVLSVVVLGFIFTLSTVSFAVLFLRAAQGNLDNAAPKSVSKTNKKTTVAAAPASKPYSEEELSFLVKGAVISAAVSMHATRAGNVYATPLRTLFLGFSTFTAYVWSARLPTGFVKAVHPLITATSLLWGLFYLTAMVTGSTFLDVLKTYKVGSYDMSKTGAGDLILFLLGPSVVSFALSMYGKKKLLKENLPIVLIANVISSVGGLFGTAAFVRLIKLGGSQSRMIRLSVLSRNVTTALSMAIAALLGGNISIAATAVVFSGILGGTYGKSLLTAMGISDPITRGLGLGAAAQGLGVASLAQEPDAFPFAAMSMVLTALFATSLVAIPPIKDVLIKLATGE
jgi:putative effector of murein hydrolase